MNQFKQRRKQFFFAHIGIAIICTHYYLYTHFITSTFSVWRHSEVSWSWRVAASCCDLTMSRRRPQPKWLPEKNREPGTGNQLGKRLRWPSSWSPTRRGYRETLLHYPLLHACLLERPTSSGSRSISISADWREEEVQRWLVPAWSECDRDRTTTRSSVKHIRRIRIEERPTGVPLVLQCSRSSTELAAIRKPVATLLTTP